MENELYTIAQVADILSVSKETLRRWEESGKLIPTRNSDNNYRLYTKDQLRQFDEAKMLFSTKWDEESNTLPTRAFSAIELFAGAGGLALGMEQAGLKSILLSEIDKHACDTLEKNRPNWNVVRGDVSDIDFTSYKDKVDVLSGGFPMSSFFLCREETWV